ncbi:hypothetical protein GCM10028800_16160 [Nesterenkonia populi]
MLITALPVPGPDRKFRAADVVAVWLLLEGAVSLEDPAFVEEPELEELSDEGASEEALLPPLLSALVCDSLSALPEEPLSSPESSSSDFASQPVVPLCRT